METVSFYVPCYNAQNYIAECIESILKQTYPLKEVIVIDDCSTDDSYKIISHYPVKIVRKEKNEGLALGRNTALNVCTSDFIASCDSDVSLAPDWLEKIMLNISDKSVAGAGGRLIERNKENLPDRWRDFHMFQHWGDNKVINPRFLYGANTLFRRDVLINIGKYNKLYRTNREDLDMCTRIKRAGHKLIYEPDAIAEHMRIDTVTGIINTFYGWKRHDYMASNAFYDNFQKLWGKINFSINTCYDIVSNEINRKCFELIYLTLLIMFRFPLRDIKECKETKNELLHAYLAVDNILSEEKHISEGLKKQILSDIIDILAPEDREKISGNHEDYNRNFINKFSDLLSDRLKKIPSLFILTDGNEPSEENVGLVNRRTKDRIRDFIQSKASSSGNFTIWETLRSIGEKSNLKLRHRSYSQLKLPSEKQKEFFWHNVEKSAERRQ